MLSHISVSYAKKSCAPKALQLNLGDESSPPKFRGYGLTGSNLVV